MTGSLALGTSVVVPLLVHTHEAHPAVTRWLGGRPAAIAGHALVESFAVLRGCRATCASLRPMPPTSSPPACPTG